MIIKENLAYKEEHKLQCLNLFIPEGEVRAIFVYFHGGGLDHGDMSGSNPWAEYITDKGIAFASANYRLYPEAKYPDFIRDAASAVAYIKSMSNEIGTDKIYIGGSSAGGYLSMMLAFDKSYLTEAGVDPESISGYFHDAGQPTAHFHVLEERGIDTRRIIVDETSPMFFVGLEEKYPRMRFIVSDNDMKNRYEQTILMLSTLKHFGHENMDLIVMNGKHCQYTRDTDDDGVVKIARMIGEFVSEDF